MQTDEEKSFVAQITAEAVRYEEASQMAEAQISSMETFIEEQSVLLLERQNKVKQIGDVFDSDLSDVMVNDQAALPNSLEKSKEKIK